MRYIIDYKSIEMESEEYDYYQKLIKEFTFGNNFGKDYFRDVFDVDTDGCITFIKPPLNKEIPWAVILFLMNLMLNQRVRRMEEKITRIIDEKANS